MSDKVYKLIEITGTSSVGLEEAIQTAITKAAKSVRNLRWFEVIETRGAIDGDKVAQWQVTLKIGFSLDD
ncbi:MAG: Dodecin [Anaerolineae bacterium]|nr:Dodecin [Anaerolineae bacterium]